MNEASDDGGVPPDDVLPATGGIEVDDEHSSGASGRVVDGNGGGYGRLDWDTPAQRLDMLINTNK